MKIDELSIVLYALGELYDKKITESILEIYFDIFKEYSVDEFKTAAYKVIKSHVYNSLPKPASILEYLEGTSDDKALMAWNLAQEAVIKVGYYDSPKFEDPIISNCIVEMGGWQWFCSVQTSELPFVERRFLDLYRLFLKRGCDPLELVGFHNAGNRLKGYKEKIKPPVLIGGKSVVAGCLLLSAIRISPQVKPPPASVGGLLNARILK